MQLAVSYVRFIGQKMQDMKFQSNQRLMLINLVTALVKSSSDQLLKKIFDMEESTQLCAIIFYRAEYDEWDSKKAHLLCFC